MEIHRRRALLEACAQTCEEMKGNEDFPTTQQRGIALLASATKRVDAQECIGLPLPEEVYMYFLRGMLRPRRQALKLLPEPIHRYYQLWEIETKLWFDNDYDASLCQSHSLLSEEHDAHKNLHLALLATLVYTVGYRCCRHFGIKATTVRI